jgi:beta-glucosidase
MVDIQSIIGQMTLEEKAALSTGASNWTTVPLERLGIPAVFMSDGPHGVRRAPEVNSLGASSLPATCFPTASCLASSWNVELLREIGEALGEEAAGLSVNLLLGPGNNMKRTPLCGRNFEYFSEDPYLAGEMAASMVAGVQSKGVGATLKHFAANNQESRRFLVNVIVDERTLREIYLPAFETAVKKAKPWAVMCAYNKLNGQHCAENPELLSNILKKEWGFEGIVVSDWGAVHDRVKALQAGLDLEMPGPRPRRGQEVVEAVRNGDLTEEVLNDSVRRILEFVFMAAQSLVGGEFDSPAHHALARRAAAEGMVLLKNDGLLPLTHPCTIAVIGRAAREPHFQGGGSSHINPTRTDNPWDELIIHAGDSRLTYAEGYPKNRDFIPDLISEAVDNARNAEAALLFLALPAFKESEGYDRTDLDLTPHQVALIQAVSAVQPRTVVILNNGSALSMDQWIHKVPAVLEAWMMGQAGAGAIADALWGEINPSGKLAETFPVKFTDVPSHLNFPGELGQVRYGEGLFIGYRYYDAKEIPVLFPFGHGLSYTTFSYSNLRVSPQTFKDIDGLQVSVDVTNTGDRAGKEIVQLYVHDQRSSLVRPCKELKGFKKVALQPGETRTLTLMLDFRSFAFYHPGHRCWVTEEGAFDLLVGASSRDIRLKQEVQLVSTVQLRSLLDRESTIKEWLEDPRGKEILEPTFQLIKNNMSLMFGGDTQEGGILGMDEMVFLLDMPLMDILNLQDPLLPSAPSEIVDSLLEKVHSKHPGS